MRWKAVLFSTFLVLGLHAPTAKAQTITIAVDASTAKQLTVTATIAGLPAGWKVSRVYIMAPPTNGAAGKGGQGSADPQPNGTYKSTIYPDPGTYDVTGVLWVNDQNNVPQLPIYSTAQKGVVVKPK